MRLLVVSTFLSLQSFKLEMKIVLPVEPIIGVTRVRVRIVAAEVIAGLSVLSKKFQ